MRSGRDARDPGFSDARPPPGLNRRKPQPTEPALRARATPGRLNPPAASLRRFNPGGGRASEKPGSLASRPERIGNYKANTESASPYAHLQLLRVELRTIMISQESFDTARSIWTFVTNQRRILGDNATEDSRSEAQLLVVKIRRGGRRTCKKRDTTK